MEYRYKLPAGIQKKYLLEIEKMSGLSGDELAEIFGIVGRSYRDWRKGKFSITKKAVEIVEERFRVTFPYPKEKAINNWRRSKTNGAREGGLAVFKKYGGPGTPEGRSKGGKRAMAILRAKGLIPPAKPFTKPKSYSKELAEFIGILLGDGHISKGQWSITLNSIVDSEYVDFVVKLVENLFGFKPGVYPRRNMNAIVISGSGVRSIEYFQKLGLKIGNKVTQQVQVPEWILQDQEFRKSCLRGLIDTDGGIFNHRYKVNGKSYSYYKLEFSNRSFPLIDFVFNTLESLGFSPKIFDKVETKRAWLYNRQEVNRYLEIVGTNNPRLNMLRRVTANW